MQCPRCGQPVVPGARFCAACGAAFAPLPGQPVAAGVPGHAIAPTFVPSSPKKWPWIVGALLATLLALGGLTATKVLRFGRGADDSSLRAGGSIPDPALRSGQDTPPPLLQAQSSPNVPGLSAPGSSPPPILGAAAAKVKMPDDVYQWLLWLEKIEREKRQLTRHQETEMQTLIATLQGAEGLTVQGVQDLTDPDSTSKSAPAMDDAQNVAKEIVKSWSELKTKFDSKPPPTECVPIATAFDNGLSGMAGNGQKILDVLNGIAGMDTPTKEDADPAIGKVKDVRYGHTEDVDKQLHRTDDLLGSICDKYGTRKWFSIDAHGGSGGLFSMPGLGQ